jgi:flavin-dependent dehydrogenase
MIAVIGASSSGLFTAWQLAQAGRTVRLYEKQQVMNPHPRRLIVTSYLFQLLSLPDDLVLHRVHAFEFFADSHRGYVQLKGPDLIIERTDLIRWLATQVRESGVDIKEGWTFSGLDQEDEEGVTVRLLHPESEKKEEFHPAVLIGADGADSAVGKALGLHQHLPAVSLLQAKITLPTDYPPHLVRIWFKRGITPYFFWLFPDSPHTGTLGVIIDDAKRAARQALDGLITQMGCEALEYEWGRTSLYVPRFKPEKRERGFRGFLVGDAAGQVKSTTVGGTIAGIRGALACVKAITKDTSYWRELAPLRRELWTHALIRRLLNPMDDGNYAKVLSSVDGNGSLLGEFSRDEVSSHLISLLVKHPHFSFTILKAMIKGL